MAVCCNNGAEKMADPVKPVGAFAATGALTPAPQLLSGGTISPSPGRGPKVTIVLPLITSGPSLFSAFFAAFFAASVFFVLSAADLLQYHQNHSALGRGSVDLPWGV